MRRRGGWGLRRRSSSSTGLNGRNLRRRVRFPAPPPFSRSWSLCMSALLGVMAAASAATENISPVSRDQLGRSGRDHFGRSRRDQFGRSERDLIGRCMTLDARACVGRHGIVEIGRRRDVAARGRAEGLRRARASVFVGQTPANGWYSSASVGSHSGLRAVCSEHTECDTA